MKISFHELIISFGGCLHTAKRFKTLHNYSVKSTGLLHTGLISSLEIDLFVLILKFYFWVVGHERKSNVVPSGDDNHDFVYAVRGVSTSRLDLWVKH